MESSAWPGWMNAGASTLRPDRSIEITSPVLTPSFFAVLVLISAALSHVIFVIGSGTSCSHATLLKRPSYADQLGANTTSIPPPDPVVPGAAEPHAVKLGAAAPGPLAAPPPLLSRAGITPSW